MPFYKTKRIIGGLLLFFFSGTEFARTAPSVEPVPEPFLSLPAALGNVQEIYSPHSLNKTPFIFHVESAHAHPEAARKIKEIIGHLKRSYGASLLFVEGASAPLQPEFLRVSSNPKLNQEFLEALVEKGELTGTDLSLLDPSIRTVGIEEAPLYRRAFEEFKTVAGSLDQSEGFLEAKKQALDKRTSKSFSPELRELLATWWKFHSGERSFVAVEKFLREDSGKSLQIDFEDPFTQFEWPQLTRLYLLQELEKRLNPEALEKEKKKLQAWLRKKRIPEAHSAPTGPSTLQYPSRLGSGAEARLSREAFEQFLEKAYPLGFRFQDYRQFTYSVAFQILKSELDAKELFEDFERLFERLFKEKTKTKEEERLLEEYRELFLLRKLLRLELTREEWERLKSTVHSQQSTKKALRWTVDRRLWTPAFRFYRLTERRELIFLRKITRELEKKPFQKAILVTGGFHTEGLAALLKKKGIGFATMTPRISGEGETGLYHKLMLRESHMERSSALLPAAVSKRQGWDIRSELGVWAETSQGITGSVNRLAPYFRDRDDFLGRSEMRTKENGPAPAPVVEPEKLKKFSESLKSLTAQDRVAILVLSGLFLSSDAPPLKLSNYKKYISDEDPERSRKGLSAFGSAYDPKNKNAPLRHLFDLALGQGLLQEDGSLNSSSRSEARNEDDSVKEIEQSIDSIFAKAERAGIRLSSEIGPMLLREYIIGDATPDYAAGHLANSAELDVSGAQRLTRGEAERKLKVILVAGRVARQVAQRHQGSARTTGIVALVLEGEISPYDGLQALKRERVSLQEAETILKEAQEEARRLGVDFVPTAKIPGALRRSVEIPRGTRESGTRFGSRLRVSVHKSYKSDDVEIEIEGQPSLTASSTEELAKKLKGLGFDVLKGGGDEILFAGPKEYRAVKFSNLTELQDAIETAIGRVEDYWKEANRRKDISFRYHGVKDQIVNVTFRMEKKDPPFLSGPEEAKKALLDYFYQFQFDREKIFGAQTQESGQFLFENGFNYRIRLEPGPSHFIFRFKVDREERGYTNLSELLTGVIEFPFARSEARAEARDERTATVLLATRNGYVDSLEIEVKQVFLASPVYSIVLILTRRHRKNKKLISFSKAPLATGIITPEGAQRALDTLEVVATERAKPRTLWIVPDRKKARDYDDFVSWIRRQYPAPVPRSEVRNDIIFPTPHEVALYSGVEKQPMAAPRIGLPELIEGLWGTSLRVSATWEDLPEILLLLVAVVPTFGVALGARLRNLGSKFILTFTGAEDQVLREFWLNVSPKLFRALQDQMERRLEGREAGLVERQFYPSPHRRARPPLFFEILREKGILFLKEGHSVRSETRSAPRRNLFAGKLRPDRPISKILVIEDEKSLSRLYLGYLGAKLGPAVSVVVKASYDEGFDELVSRPGEFGWILTHRNGADKEEDLKFVKRVREILGEKMPMLFVSKAKPFSEQELDTIGNADQIEKPLDFPFLLGLAESLVVQSQTIPARSEVRTDEWLFAQARLEVLKAVDLVDRFVARDQALSAKQLHLSKFEETKYKALLHVLEGALDAYLKKTPETKSIDRWAFVENVHELLAVTEAIYRLLNRVEIEIAPSPHPAARNHERKDHPELLGEGLAYLSNVLMRIYPLSRSWVNDSRKFDKKVETAIQRAVSARKVSLWREVPHLKWKGDPLTRQIASEIGATPFFEEFKQILFGDNNSILLLMKKARELHWTRRRLSRNLRDPKAELISLALRLLRFSEENHQSVDQSLQALYRVKYSLYVLIRTLLAHPPRTVRPAKEIHEMPVYPGGKVRNAFAERVIVRLKSHVRDLTQAQPSEVTREKIGEEKRRWAAALDLHVRQPGFPALFKREFPGIVTRLERDRGKYPETVPLLLDFAGHLQRHVSQKLIPRTAARSEMRNEIEVVTSDRFAAYSAEKIAEEIRSLQKEKRWVNIVLATGKTMIPVYEALAMEKEIDWTRVRVFHLDEFKNVTVDDPSSFAYFLKKHLLNKVPIPKDEDHIFFIKDPKHDPLGYVERLRERGGADIILLGTNRRGHLAFNEPPSGLDRLDMREVKLLAETVEDNVGFYPGLSEPENQLAYTMSLWTIFGGRRLFLLANGIKKAPIIKQVFQGQITPEVPASYLRTSPLVTYILDTEAASGLSRVTRSEIRRNDLAKISGLELPFTFREPGIGPYRFLAAVGTLGIGGKNWKFHEQRAYERYLGAVYLEMVLDGRSEAEALREIGALENVTLDGVGLDTQTKTSSEETPVILQVDLNALDPRDKASLEGRLRRLPPGSVVVGYVDQAAGAEEDFLSPLVGKYPLLHYVGNSYSGKLNLEVVEAELTRAAQTYRVSRANAGFLFSDPSRLESKTGSVETKLKALDLAFQFDPQKVPSRYRFSRGLSAAAFGELARYAPLRSEVRQRLLAEARTQGILGFSQGAHSFQLNLWVEDRLAQLISASA